MSYDNFQPVDPSALATIPDTCYRSLQVLPARFLAKFKINESGCWIWIGSTWGHPRYKKHAYGQIRVGAKRISAHVFAYTMAHGPIPEGCEIDHRCHTKLCVNPAHLEAVSHAENMNRMAARRKAVSRA